MVNISTEKICVLPSGRQTDKLKPFKDDNRFSCVDIRMYSPKERAELLYNAITAKNSKGYCYNNIYLGGGNGAEDTIKALEELLQTPPQKEFPLRQNNLNIFGFSDASQLFHYLGQRGVATPIYYSGSDIETLFSDITKLLQKQKENSSISMELKVINNPDNKTELNGFTQPGSITSIEHRPTHQLQPFKKGYNMLMIELTNSIQIERLAETLNQMDNKDIALVLSKDTPKNMIDSVRNKFPKTAIFWGALVGHISCLKEGKPIPLFAETRIKITGNTAKMEIQPVASKQAKKLQNNPKRKCPKTIEDKENSTTKVTIEDSDVAGRAIISDLSKIKQNAKRYEIHIKNAGPDYTWQKMEMGVKELLERGIIDPNTLQQLDFNGACKADDLNRITRRIMKELASQYLPKLKTITYNGSKIPINGLKDFLTEKSEALDWASAPERHNRETAVMHAIKSGKILSQNEVIKLRNAEEKSRFEAHKRLKKKSINR